MTLILRRARPSDAAAMAQQLADPDIFPGLLQLPYAHEEVWQQRLSAPPVAGSAEMLLLAERDGQIIGSAGIHPAGTQVRRRHSMMLGISVLKSARGQGVGDALMTALLDYADNWAQVLRIELTVYHDNAGAIRLYERHGFEHEGRLRAYALRDGVYVDALAMGRLHPKQPMVRT
ncbi:GNAT family N-acetyltransferase [Roseateles asaccharophilus]|uniref:Acetyltransferase n=1 Tax=Roseateles asaccharophilus TaxID=582607 RepID=A0ABU2A9N8_9BURK|nr:GNAT family N-acetyltransferase [Roseateles asaccharophilus]MDR7333725.1 putative acetyltransferase [Roseateles asaccharophilus]